MGGNPRQVTACITAIVPMGAAATVTGQPAGDAKRGGTCACLLTVLERLGQHRYYCLKTSEISGAPAAHASTPRCGILCAACHGRDTKAQLHMFVRLGTQIRPADATLPDAKPHAHPLAKVSMPRPTRMCSGALTCCSGVQTAHAACPAGIRRETLCELSPARCSPQRSTARPAPPRRGPVAYGRDGVARRLHAPWAAAAAAASVRAFNQKLPVQQTPAPADTRSAAAAAVEMEVSRVGALAPVRTCGARAWMLRRSVRHLGMAGQAGHLTSPALQVATCCERGGLAGCNGAALWAAFLGAWALLITMIYSLCRWRAGSAHRGNSLPPQPDCLHVTLVTIV